MQIDDNVFDEDGILRDGRAVRVRMTMRDNLPPPRRAVVNSFVTDGTNDGMALHRPGYRFRRADSALGDSMSDARANARDAYEARLVTAWRKPTRGNGIGYEVETPRTVNNADNPDVFSSPVQFANGTCVPDRMNDSRGSSAQDQRKVALQDYDRWLTLQWRRH